MILKTGENVHSCKMKLIVMSLAVIAAVILLQVNLYAAYEIKKLATLGGSDFEACDINDKGQVVGYSDIVGNSNIHAFIWENGEMRDLGTLGGESSVANGINEKGQVVGYSKITGDSAHHAFIWENGEMKALDTIQGIYSSANGINEKGQVVGDIDIWGSSDSHAFIWENGEMKDLGTLGGRDSGATGINDKGQVVGYSEIVGNSALHAFIWENGEMKDLGTLGGMVSHATGINDKGQVVGYSTTAEPVESHAFIWENGEMKDLGTLGGDFSVATGINDKGQVVGYFFIDGSIAPHAFIWENGEMKDLGALGGYLSVATGINDKGQIVGYSHSEETFDEHACIWENTIPTPTITPTPTSTPTNTSSTEIPSSTPTQTLAPASNFDFDALTGTINGYNGKYVKLKIPSQIDGVIVKNIGDYAFSDCRSLISITIPSSVESIGDMAFYKCSSLTSITIPSSVTSIGYNAFGDCSSLTSITIPSGLTSIGDIAFCDCFRLTSVIIPSSVESIGNNAFYYCLSLTSITIPSSVKNIGDSAFANCSSLTSITIPSSVTSIGGYAFSGCNNLVMITPVSSYANNYAMKNCIPVKLTSVLTVKTEGNGNVSDWSNGESKSYPLGEKVILKAIADKDTAFLYWKDGDRGVISTDPEYTYIVGIDVTLTAIFAAKEKYLVTFKNGNGDVIQSVSFSDGSEITFPKAPAMFGYKFIGWDKTADEIKAITDDIVVTALFEKIEDTVTMSVYGGTGSGEYNFKDYVTIVADAPEMGQKFSHWTDEKGNILCYDTTFKFYVSRGLILTAMYVPETETIYKKANISITSITKTDDKISFVAERLVPEVNKIVSHGIIVTNKASTGTLESEFILGKTDVLKAQSNTKSLVGTFVLNKIAALNETWYARAYVIYMNSAGEVFTIYSDIVDHTIS